MLSEGIKRDDVPVGDVVIFPLLAMEVTLDRVAAVVKQEDDRLEFHALHDGQLLDSQLDRTVTNEQDRPVLADIASSDGSTESSADGPADGAPEDLRDEDGVLW